jgi:NAD(P)-dependent dehydrogenase (short-subunit alcohol dehydrogenase family)
MSVDLKGRTCVVTGSAKSIGLGVAEMYAGLGAKVAMIDLNPEVVTQAERLSKAGHCVKGYIVDITDRTAVMACFGDRKSVV